MLHIFAKPISWPHTSAARTAHAHPSPFPTAANGEAIGDAPPTAPSASPLLIESWLERQGHGYKVGFGRFSIFVFFLLHFFSFYRWSFSIFQFGFWLIVCADIYFSHRVSAWLHGTDFLLRFFFQFQKNYQCIAIALRPLQEWWSEKNEIINSKNQTRSEKTKYRRDKTKYLRETQKPKP